MMTKHRLNAEPQTLNKVTFEMAQLGVSSDVKSDEAEALVERVVISPSDIFPLSHSKHKLGVSSDVKSDEAEALVERVVFSPSPTPNTSWGYRVTSKVMRLRP